MRRMHPTLTPDQVQQFTAWVDRQESQSDTLTLVPARGLAATLDQDPTTLQLGAVLPALWHWIYFLPQAMQGQLGRDGHPRRGGFLPPVPLPRRMWAGGQITWVADNPLKLGQDVERTSRIASVEHKVGRTGEMVFVKVEHTFSNAHGPALVEFHDIVYRHAAEPGAAPPDGVPAETGAPWQRDWLPDPVMLFRYSALTFNGHRIHYDRSYVMCEEGYPGLVVHGPLIATLLLDLVRHEAGERPLASFQFRAQRPTFDGVPMRVNGAPSTDGRGVRLWAQDDHGWLTMSATADFA